MVSSAFASPLSSLLLFTRWHNRRRPVDALVRALRHPLEAPPPINKRDQNMREQGHGAKKRYLQHIPEAVLKYTCVSCTLRPCVGPLPEGFLIFSPFFPQLSPCNAPPPRFTAARKLF